MAGSVDQEDGVVAGRGRKAAAHGQVDADAVADHSAHSWPHGHAVSGAVRDAAGQGAEKAAGDGGRHFGGGGGRPEAAEAGRDRSESGDEAREARSHRYG